MCTWQFMRAVGSAKSAGRCIMCELSLRLRETMNGRKVHGQMLNYMLLCAEKVLNMRYNGLALEHDVQLNVTQHFAGAESNANYLA